jgi:hypothetical protein
LVLAIAGTLVAGAAHSRAPFPIALMPADSPVVSLEAPPEVRAGEAVPLTLRVTNTGDRPLTLHLRGRPVAFDLVVSRGDGSIVWRRLEGAMIAMVLQVRTLAPGEALLLEDTWRQQTTRGARVPPGDYTVTAELLIDSPLPLRSSPSSLRIVAR